jgi:hypothetical protein
LPFDTAMNGFPCECHQPHEARRVVLTGGPGAGKTAVLELVRKYFCKHVRVLPESASILFGGGFPREDSLGARKAVQRAIFLVQHELENLAGEAPPPAITLCDRGTLDGIAYWPGPPLEMLGELGTSRERELARYDAVIHLRTPSARLGYNHSNVLRTEPAALAADIDWRILDVWSEHPRRFVIDSAPDFLVKVAQALRILASQVPACCRPPADVRLENEGPADSPR